MHGVTPYSMLVFVWVHVILRVSFVDVSAHRISPWLRLKNSIEFCTTIGDDVSPVFLKIGMIVQCNDISLWRHFKRCHEDVDWFVIHDFPPTSSFVPTTALRVSVSGFSLSRSSWIPPSIWVTGNFSLIVAGVSVLKLRDEHAHNVSDTMEHDISESTFHGSCATISHLHLCTDKITWGSMC